MVRRVANSKQNNITAHRRAVHRRRYCQCVLRGVAGCHGAYGDMFFCVVFQHMLCVLRTRHGMLSWCVCVCVCRCVRGGVVGGQKLKNSKCLWTLVLNFHWVRACACVRHGSSEEPFCLGFLVKLGIISWRASRVSTSSLIGANESMCMQQFQCL